MGYLIDGHNLIGSGLLPGIRLQDDEDEYELVNLLRLFRSRTRDPITVVFDAGIVGGRSAELSGGGVDVFFARQGMKADTVIYERVKRMPKRSTVIVVTSDRELAARCRAEGAQTITAAEFVKRLDGPSKQRNLRSQPDSLPDEEAKPSVGSVEEWLEVFPEPKPRLKAKSKAPAAHPTPQPVNKPSPVEKKPAQKAKKPKAPEFMGTLEEWLEIFPEPEADPDPRQASGQQGKEKPASGTKRKPAFTGSIQEWLEIFGKKPPKRKK